LCERLSDKSLVLNAFMFTEQRRRPVRHKYRKYVLAIVEGEPYRKAFLSHVCALNGAELDGWFSEIA